MFFRIQAQIFACYPNCSSSENFIRGLLATAEKEGATSGQVKAFIRDELGRDGILVLRLMTANSGSLITAQVSFDLPD